MKFVIVAVMSLILAVPTFGKTYKSTYPVACSQVWDAVKDTLNNAENYTVVTTDDKQMTAAYDVKHSAHVNVAGALLQRTNKVTLVSNGTGCEMQVVSNYSGWEHNDKGDFKTRVDESLAKLKAATPSEPAKDGGRGQVTSRNSSSYCESDGTIVGPIAGNQQWASHTLTGRLRCSRRNSRCRSDCDLHPILACRESSRVHALISIKAARFSSFTWSKWLCPHGLPGPSTSVLVAPRANPRRIQLR